MKRALRCIHPATGDSHRPRIEVDVTFDPSGSLIAEFAVHASERHVNPALSRSGPQWGLWDWDVVELFVHSGGLRSGLPYYEFQVSPLGQYFELEIFEPRQRVNREYRSGGRFDAKDLGASWTARMEIPLTALGAGSNPRAITGNAFAILGQSSRTYWSLFLDPQETPDFHCPEVFAPLFR